MTLVNDIRKTVTDTTPVYAAVGVTDLAVEKVRHARARALAARADFHVGALQDKAAKRAEALQDRAAKRAEQVAEQAQRVADRAEKVAEQAQQIPALALNQTLEVAGKAHATYTDLAVRGEKLVTRLRNQKATKDLLAQAGTTVSFGKGAVTTVRKAVRGEAKATKRAVRKSGPATRLSTKPTPTARKSTAAAKRATKATVTSAGKAATAATTAVKAAAPKIGD
jgi:heparin binding hemagglutinin HbhA